MRVAIIACGGDIRNLYETAYPGERDSVPIATGGAVASNEKTTRPANERHAAERRCLTEGIRCRSRRAEHVAPNGKTTRPANERHAAERRRLTEGIRCRSRRAEH